MLSRALLPMLVFLSMAAATALAAEARFVDDRHAYVRGESVTLRLAAEQGDEVAFDVSGWLPGRVRIDAGLARYVIETARLRAGDYEVKAQPLQEGRPLGGPVVFPLTIAPERNPQRFPVWNWAGADDPDLSWWTARGFNGLRLSSARDPIAGGGGRGERTAQVLDEGTRLGIDIGAYFYPLGSRRWAEGRDGAAHCRLPDGTRDPSRVYPRVPAVLDHGRRTAATWVDRYADYPSFRHALLNSEYQVPFCTNDEVRALARQEAGVELGDVLRPEWIRGAFAIDAAKLPGALQPEDGLIADDHPVYRFLKWWWERGHGTSVLNAEMARAIKDRKPGVVVWHDPYRLAPVYHSHQDLDAISTWTYGHPDIKRLGYTAVLQAAAKPAGQKVMQTITLYLYSRFVMAMGQPTARPQADQAGRDPFFVAGPDYTREAIWLVISQRPDILGFYTPGAARPFSPRVDPHVSSPETFDAIGEVCRALVEPFGPAVLEARRLRPRVAVLNSATSDWFPGASPGYSYANEHILPYCSLLMMNHVPFDVLLDDDITAGRLDGYDLLVIPRGDTLTRSAHERISAFARTKKVIANATMRAKVPGAAITDFDFSFERAVDGQALAQGRALTAEEHRARMEAYAKRLAPLVAEFRGPATSDSRRVLINTLESGDLRYVFLINDERTYGPRFGAAKLHFEAGVRQTANVRLQGTTAAGEPAVYDALAGRRLSPSWADGSAELAVTLPAARGKLLAILPEPVGAVEVSIPPEPERGQPLPIAVRVRGASGKPFRGAIPLRIDITDPLGRRNEYSRYAAAVGDPWTLTIHPALNDPAGSWTVRVTELLGGTGAEETFVLP
jgi:hypothetical protein